MLQADMQLQESNLDRQRALLLEYPHQPLKGQVALVTGGNSGIGEGCLRHLAAAGAAVAINYVSAPEKAQAIADQIIESGGRAKCFLADVSDEAQVMSM